MFNISEKTVITGMEKTGCTIGHLQHQLCVSGAVCDRRYDYFGKNVRRGTCLVQLKNGIAAIRFRVVDGWAKELQILDFTANEVNA